MLVFTHRPSLRAEHTVPSYWVAISGGQWQSAQAPWCLACQNSRHQRLQVVVTKGKRDKVIPPVPSPSPGDMLEGSSLTYRLSSTLSPSPSSSSPLGWKSAWAAPHFYGWLELQVTRERGKGERAEHSCLLIYLPTWLLTLPVFPGPSLAPLGQVGRLAALAHLHPEGGGEEEGRERLESRENPPVSHTPPAPWPRCCSTLGFTGQGSSSSH